MTPISRREDTNVDGTGGHINQHQHQDDTIRNDVDLATTDDNHHDFNEDHPPLDHYDSSHRREQGSDHSNYFDHLFKHFA